MKDNLKPETAAVLEGKPGVYAGVPMETYHRVLAGVSKTDIENAALSMANMIARRSAPEDESEALLIGKMMHARIEFHQSPEKYKALFTVMPEFSGTGSRAAKADWLKANSGKLILEQSQVDLIEAMFDGVMRNPQSRALVEADGSYEDTLLWVDKDTGAKCKARPDKRIPDYLGTRVGCDWKTIGRFSKHAIQEAIEDYGYFVSAPFTMDGEEAVGRGIDTYVLVFIEKSAPYRVLCVPVEQMDIDIGRKYYKRILRQIVECQKTNVWPGFVSIGMSHYARERLMEQLAGE